MFSRIISSLFILFITFTIHSNSSLPIIEYSAINHPEIILSRILDLLGSHGIDANWWCDATDEEYFMLGDDDLGGEGETI